MLVFVFAYVLVALAFTLRTHISSNFKTSAERNGVVQFGQSGAVSNSNVPAVKRTQADDLAATIKSKKANKRKTEKEISSGPGIAVEYVGSSVTGTWL